jgi:hypothetical protein
MTTHRTVQAHPVRLLAAALAIAAASSVIAAAPAPASTVLAAASVPSPSTVNAGAPQPKGPIEIPRPTADNDRSHSLIFVPGCYDANLC